MQSHQCQSLCAFASFAPLREIPLYLYQMSSSHALRLLPGADLKQSIEDYIAVQKIEAGWVLTCVGSLRTVALRFANQKETTLKNGFFEIVCLTGTISVNGCHLHCNVSDETGNTTGGHLMEGSIIFTTAEIILGESKKHVFTREKDSATGFNELKIAGR